jgi:hypothetical protein
MSPTSVVGRTDCWALGTSMTTLLSNAAASGQALKVTSIRAVNADGANPADVDLVRLRSGTERYLGPKGIPIPGLGCYVFLSREEYIYLEEGDEIRAKASVAGDVELWISWEVVS